MTEHIFDNCAEAENTQRFANTEHRQWRPVAFPSVFRLAAFGGPCPFEEAGLRRVVLTPFYL
jgi:hypothetical protein